MDELHAEFLAETHESLARIERACASLERHPSDWEALRLALRLLHGIKGTCGFLAFAALETSVQAVEAALCDLRDRRRSITPATFDAVFAGLDGIRATLAELDQTAGAWREDGPRPSEVRVPTWRLLRIVPVLAQNLALVLHKSIDVQVEGAQVEVDRDTLNALRAPLIQLIRNAADHGLETADERRRSGKRPTGTIRLNMRREAAHVVLDIADDGRGIQMQRIRRTIVERGMISTAEAAALSEREIVDYLFRPGFSTAPQTGAISGRGIGLDVVRAALDEIGGTVAVESVPGRGTRITLRVPVADEAVRRARYSAVAIPAVDVARAPAYAAVG